MGGDMTNRSKKGNRSTRTLKSKSVEKNADVFEAPIAEPTEQLKLTDTKTAQIDADALPNPERPESTLLKFSRRLLWKAHWIAPNLLPDRFGDKAYLEARDKKSNEESRVDSSEELRVRAVWGIELFGPNESDQLYEALRVLNWSAGYGRAQNEALTWVQEQRSYGHGGFYNVGIVTQSSRPQQFMMVRNHASLPEDVDHLTVSLHQVVPTVTCIVVCFVLKEEVAARYEQAMNKIHASKSERSSGWSISRVEPFHIKQREVEAIRGRFRRMATNWFQRNLPGHFSRSNTPQRFPTAELLTTKSEDVFADSPSKITPDWRRIVSDFGVRDIWTSKYLPGLRFTLKPGRWPRGSENFLSACVSLQSFPEEKIRLYGGSPRAIVASCHEVLEGALACFAVSAFLAEVASDLKNTREDLSISKSNRRTMHTIDRIQRFFDRNAGVPSVLRELRDLTKVRGHIEHTCGDFETTPWKADQPSRDFAMEIREGLNFRASALIEDESSTREHFEQLSTVLSIRESIRAQRKMEVLTIVALIVATVSLVAAVPDGWVAVLKTLLFNFQA